MEYKTDVAIIGAGLAGLVTAYELLDTGRRITIFDRDTEENLGGLAKESFGGIFFVDSPLQRRAGIRDSIDLAMKDWFTFAEFGENDTWPKQWAEHFITHTTSQVYQWLHQEIGIRFFPVVHWTERGWSQPGNSVPRFHMVWGTGYELNRKMINALKKHPGFKNIVFKFNHRVTELTGSVGKVTGFAGLDEKNNEAFSCDAKDIVIASGGISGNIPLVKDTWFKAWGKPPEFMLNGSHQNSLGDLHRAAEKIDASVTHLDLQWNYAAGVHHPEPKRELHGLSLIPPRSSLWLNYQGTRIGPPPLIAGFDTRFLVQKICEQEKKFSWQVMNRKILKKELAVSGSDYNDAIKNKNFPGFIYTLLFGNHKLLQTMKTGCRDFITANSVEELAGKMNALNGNNDVDPGKLKETILNYDLEVEKGSDHWTDEQLVKIREVKKYRGDRIRMSRNQKILEPGAMPLVAIREFILTRKSLGGIQTDLNCRVLDVNGNPIDGLYSVGEASGFGGGGIHGKRSLEGTFLGNCIFNGRIAAKTIKG